ncbi:MAG: phosphoribosylanthranilate isomerase [Prevotella sp.]
MIIKVCGLREPENIRDISSLGVDMIGFIFCPDSKRFVRQVPSYSGTIPNTSSIGNVEKTEESPLRVGVFVNDMPQTIITRVYDSHLDCIQLHGEESPTYIDNLRQTIVPDIAGDIKIIKAISIREADDVKRWREYSGHADLLLFDTQCEQHGGSGSKFDWNILNEYDGDIPFLLSGGIGPDDAMSIKSISHPMMIGVDINSRFETEPGVKDVGKVKAFMDSILS